MNGGFQAGPFQIDYQQVIPLPATPGQFPIGDYVGLDWYAASYNIFKAGLIQGTPPFIVPVGMLAPGTVVAQMPAVGTPVSPGTTIQLTVAMEGLLSVTFNLLH